MFSSFFQNLQTTIEKVRNHFFSKINYILTENDISRLTTKTKNKSSDIINEAKINSQNEMIKRTLRKREIQLENTLKPQREIQQGKDLTRERLYRTLRQKQKEQNKEKTKEHVFTK